MARSNVKYAYLFPEKFVNGPAKDPLNSLAKKRNPSPSKSKLDFVEELTLSIGV